MHCLIMPIPILLLVVKFIFQMFNKLNENKNYYLLSILLPYYL